MISFTYNLRKFGAQGQQQRNPMMDMFPGGRPPGLGGQNRGFHQ